MDVMTNIRFWIMLANISSLNVHFPGYTMMRQLRNILATTVSLYQWPSTLKRALFCLQQSVLSKVTEKVHACLKGPWSKHQANGATLSVYRMAMSHIATTLFAWLKHSNSIRAGQLGNIPSPTHKFNRTRTFFHGMLLNQLKPSWLS